MSRFRIVNSLNGKKLYKKDSALDIYFNETKMNADLVRYWGDIEDEKLFIIPFWKAEEFANNSDTNQLAFKVTNIENRSEMHTSWINFNSDSTEAFKHEMIKDSGKQITVWVTRLVSTEHQTYFVFGQDLLNLFRNAIDELGVKVKFESIVARIGRNSNNIPNVYFILGKIELHLGPSAGGESNACGVKIPPPK